MNEECMHALKIVVAETRTTTVEASKAAIRSALKDIVDVVDILEVPPHGKQAVANALGYAIRSTVGSPAELNYKEEGGKVDFGIVERLIASEFWHALNRRKMVKNEDVNECIAATYKKLGHSYKPPP